MLTHSPSADWIAAHRRAWARKPGLRAVYTRWFDWLYAARVPGATVVELGCGPAFFKQRYPDVIATDTTTNPHADALLDAAGLPFADGAVGTYVLLDVFHHLPDPVRFLAAAARTLRRGGRIAMIEPWLGASGRLLYRYVHHEECDCRVDASAPWTGTAKDPMRGNVALPYVFFRAGGCLETLGLPLRVRERQPFAALPWILSGGFQPLDLLPPAVIPAVDALDRLLSRAPALTATRCALVLERDD